MSAADNYRVASLRQTSLKTVTVTVTVPRHHPLVVSTLYWSSVVALAVVLWCIPIIAIGYTSEYMK